MPLVRLDKVSLAYGHLPLLKDVDFQIDAAERVCLVGRNGTGKTTLFRVISGAALPDEGVVWRPDTLRIAHLEQEVPPDSDQTIFQVVASGLADRGALLAEFHQITRAAAKGRSASLQRLSELQTLIEARDGWNIQQKVEAVLTRLKLAEDSKLSDCSGGTRRRVMLARALVSEPDLLLLDEPTNHLDINAIIWLEKYLLHYRGALLFITHDRAFVRRLATRIVELDRGRIASFAGDFDAYLRRKDELLAIEERANAKFDKKLAAEEAWIRRGIKARRTRDEGRVRALQALRKEKAQRLETQHQARFGIDAGAPSGKLVVDVRRVNFRYGEEAIIRDFSTRILRGDRVGIIGPNGSGKSTLLRLILGELNPTSGEIVRGTRLRLAHFDQHRRLLDPKKTVRENLSDADYVVVRGRTRHAVGHLKEFLFPPERIDSPVNALSGGERNRLLLAKIFTRPANMMALDEPTNDLDVDTLELLEELLADYGGTLLLVSHDRSFLDNVVTSTLVFEGSGRFGEYAGGYEDWERYQRKIPEPPREVRKSAPAPPPTAAPPARTETRRKLSYKEQRELEVLPERIDALEHEQAQLQAQMGEGDFYRQESGMITAAMKRMEAIAAELDACYARWQELEAMGRGEG